MIPKKIHYCWFGRKPLPNDVKKCIKSWKKYAPDYEIIEWNEDNFDVNCHPFSKAAYENKAWAFVSDYARLKIIYDNGGIYLDTDVELIKSLDEVLKCHCFVGCQQNQHLIATGLGFGAEKGHAMIAAMLDEYDSISFNFEKRREFACPFLNTAAFEKHEYLSSEGIVEVNGATVFPPEYLDPYPSGAGDGKIKMTDNTISIHHYSASWTTGKNRWKRKFARFIGEDKIIRLKNIIKRNKK